MEDERIKLSFSDETEDFLFEEACEPLHYRDYNYLTDIVLDFKDYVQNAGLPLCEKLSSNDLINLLEIDYETQLLELLPEEIVEEETVVEIQPQSTYKPSNKTWKSLAPVEVVPIGEPEPIVKIQIPCIEHLQGTCKKDEKTCLFIHTWEKAPKCLEKRCSKIVFCSEVQHNGKITKCFSNHSRTEICYLVHNRETSSQYLARILNKGICFGEKCYCSRKHKQVKKPKQK